MEQKSRPTKAKKSIVMKPKPSEPFHFSKPRRPSAKKHSMMDASIALTEDVLDEFTQFPPSAQQSRLVESRAFEQINEVDLDETQ